MIHSGHAESPMAKHFTLLLPNFIRQDQETREENVDVNQRLVLPKILRERKRVLAMGLSARVLISTRDCWGKYCPTIEFVHLARSLPAFLGL